MTIPIPEPAADIEAQLAALLDPGHPKRACFLVPGNLPPGVLAADTQIRPEGVLLTQDPALARLFRDAPEDVAGFDRAMAAILGLPEAKPDAEARCGGDPTRARVVQARDTQDRVVTEALASPVRLALAVAEMRRHVPAGGRLVVLSLAQVLERRRRLRQQEQTIDG